MTIFLTSDQHYGHTNIIKYSKRPFANVEEMNEQLIIRFNARVGTNDVVYHVGDFSLQERYVPEILPRQNGTHHLIMGNHDKCHPHRNKHLIESIARYRDYGFASVSLHIEMVEFVISHMPYKDPGDKRYPEYRLKRKGNKILLHGHVHERWKYRDGQLNIGVDQWNYAPVSLDEVRAFLKDNK
jgi:calcineurin-like phosphoesterase family protein